MYKLTSGTHLGYSSNSLYLARFSKGIALFLGRGGITHFQAHDWYFILLRVHSRVLVVAHGPRSAKLRKLEKR
jgi:hypothetical protein